MNTLSQTLKQARIAGSSPATFNEQHSWYAMEGAAVAAALAELEQVFALIAQEHQDRGQALPKDTTEIVHA